MSLHKEYLIFMILVACTKILDLQSELYYAILHKKQNFKYISLLQIGKSLIIIVPFAITIFIFKSVLIGLIIQIVAQFVWLILFESKVTKLISKNNEVSLNKKLIFIFF